MATKAKKRLHRMPPLSFVDKLIYWTAFLLLIAGTIALIFFPLYLRRKIAFSDSAAIAMADHASLLWLLVPLMTFSLMTFILWLQPYQNRKPIFGRKNFKYGPPAWPKVYPLFMKNKPYVYESRRKQEKQKRVAVILLVVLLISFIPFPLSLYGRDCLRSDGSIMQYNMFNVQTQQFSPGDIADIEIETYRYGGKGTWPKRYGVQMVFRTTGGKTYTFRQRDFRKDTDAEISYWLEAMLNVKERYDPRIIHYDDLKRLDRVVADNGLSGEEVDLLYKLFGQ